MGKIPAITASIVKKSELEILKIKKPIPTKRP
jgi:hypothetical protein